jgi:hypothetical protein
MAKFDIEPSSPGSGNARGAVWTLTKANSTFEANYEPTILPGLQSDSTRMRAPKGVARPISWGRQPQRGAKTLAALLVGNIAIAAADPAFAPTKTAPDPPPPASAQPRPLPPTWDLDGLYVWLGPTGAASHVQSQWDSTVGADVAVIRVREHDTLAAIGGSLGASKWTVRGGERAWLDFVVGTPLGGRIVGASLGPIVEFADFAPAHVGGSIGVWAFLGVVPYVRAGYVDALGPFVEIGLHVALPVWRRHVRRAD